MYIHFKNRKLRETLEKKAQTYRKYGQRQGEKIHQRLGEIEAAQNLSELKKLPGPKCHKLKGDRDGQYAVHVMEPFRIILEPITNDNILVEENITELMVIEIINYH